MLIAVIEYELNPGVEAEFQAALSEMLEKVKTIDGYLGEEPCRSVLNEQKRVTISYWRDEAALKAWRQDRAHRRVMALGRDRLLAWYRIRVGEVVRDYGMGEDPASHPAAALHG